MESDSTNQCIYTTKDSSYPEISCFKEQKDLEQQHSVLQFMNIKPEHFCCFHHTSVVN